MASKSQKYYQLDLKAAIEFLLKEDLDSFLPKLKFTAFCLVSKLVFDHDPPADMVSETTQKLLHRLIADLVQPARVNELFQMEFHRFNATPWVGRTCTAFAALCKMIGLFKNYTSVQWKKFNSLLPALGLLCGPAESYYGPLISSLLNDLVSFYSKNPDFDFGGHLDAMAGPVLPAGQRRLHISEVDLRGPPQYPWSYQHHERIESLLCEARRGYPSLSAAHARALATDCRLATIANMDDVCCVATVRSLFSFYIYVDEASPELSSVEAQIIRQELTTARETAESYPMPDGLASWLQSHDPVTEHRVKDLMPILSAASKKIKLKGGAIDYSLELPKVIFKPERPKTRGGASNAQQESTQDATSKAESSKSINVDAGVDARTSPALDAVPERQSKRKKRRPMEVLPGESEGVLQQMAGRAVAALLAGDHASATRQFTDIISQQGMAAVDPQNAAAIHVLRARVLLTGENPSMNEISMAETSIAAATACVGSGFPAAHALQARVDLFRYRFGDAMRGLLSLQDYLNNDRKPQPLLFPFSTEQIPWTSRDGLLLEIPGLLLQAKYAPQPDHRCRYPVCKDSSIYVNQYNRKDFKVLTCSRKCATAFHADCFRKIQEACGLKIIDNVKGGTIPCPTPQCYGVVAIIRLYHKDGGVFKTLKSEVPLTKHSAIVCESPLQFRVPVAAPPPPSTFLPVRAKQGSTSPTEPGTGTAPHPSHPPGSSFTLAGSPGKSLHSASSRPPASTASGSRADRPSDTAAAGSSPSLPEGQRETPPSTSGDGARAGSASDRTSDRGDSTESDTPDSYGPPERRFVVTLKR